MHITALGFDFGLKKIGVAVGQTLTKTATPLEIIPAKHNSTDFDAIEKLIKAWKPQVIVVGMPYQEDGTMQDMTRYAQDFADHIQQNFAEKYKLKVVTIDERYSSLEAQQKFVELRQNKLIKQGMKIDAIAAAVILERWLQNN